MTNPQPVEDGELRELIDALLLRHGTGSRHLRNELLQLFSAQQSKHQEELKEAYTQGYTSGYDAVGGYRPDRAFEDWVKHGVHNQ